MDTESDGWDFHSMLDGSEVSVLAVSSRLEWETHGVKATALFGLQLCGTEGHGAAAQIGIDWATHRLMLVGRCKYIFFVCFCPFALI